MKLLSLWSRVAFFCACLALFVAVASPFCDGYSVLTHEEIVDLLWNDHFVPLLKAKFPEATDADLKDAHAYAYGGSVIQDIGYYPFGNHVFSDLVHYVRSGDFVISMLSDAQNLQEYAFALGSVAHYIADIHGHPFINLAVGMEYPNLARLYGPAVPYDVDHAAHLKTEFGFDVLQVAKGRYAPEQFHDFIGFKVAASLLERAFFDTYGLPLTDVMPREDLAINTYRRSISQILPEMTKVALLIKGDELKREIPNFNRQHFLYHLSRADYRKSWGTGFKEPGPGAHIMAGIFRVLPKVGPLRAIDFKEPTPATENLYFKSVNETIDSFRSALRELAVYQFKAPNIDLDTGKPTKREEYPLTDATYRELLDELAYGRFKYMDLSLRRDLIAFYEGYGLPKPKYSRLDPCVVLRWRKTYIEQNQVKSFDLLDEIDAMHLVDLRTGAVPAEWEPAMIDCGE